MLRAGSPGVPPHFRAHSSGAEAAEFLARIRALLERPLALAFAFA